MIEEEGNIELTTFCEETPRYTVFVVVTLSLTDYFMPVGVVSSAAKRTDTEIINRIIIDKNFFISNTHY